MLDCKCIFVLLFNLSSRTICCFLLQVELSHASAELRLLEVFYHKIYKVWIIQLWFTMILWIFYIFIECKSFDNLFHKSTLSCFCWLHLSLIGSHVSFLLLDFPFEWENWEYKWPILDIESRRGKLLYFTSSSMFLLNVKWGLMLKKMAFV